MTLIKDAVFSVIDTETTGLKSETDRIVEIASVATTARRVVGMWATLVNPGIPIPPETSAIHMLTDEDVADAIVLSEAIEQLGEFERCMTAAANVAHNAQFDQPFVEGTVTDISWTCTKRLAQHIWPHAPTFRNQGLRYWRKLKVDTFGILPHRALADGLVTSALLRDMLSCEEFKAKNISTITELFALSSKQILLQNWPKGKFYGKPIGAADTSYIRWCLGATGMTDMDADFRFTLETYLKEIRA